VSKTAYSSKESEKKKRRKDLELKIEKEFDDL
jgi:hypothetical protein